MCCVCFPLEAEAFSMRGGRDQFLDQVQGDGRANGRTPRTDGKTAFRNADTLETVKRYTLNSGFDDHGRLVHKTAQHNDMQIQYTSFCVHTEDIIT